MLIKVCKKCGTPKAETEFNKSNSTKDKLKSLCKVCDRKREQDRYNSNKEDKIKKVREWQAEHKEEVNRYRARWSEKQKGA